MKENNEYEMNKLFGESYDEMMKEKKDVESFIKVFDNKFNKWLDQKEEDLREPIEKMINDFRMLGNKWKERQYWKLRTKNMKNIE